MRLVLGTLVLAAVLGLVTGGRWSRLAELRIGWVPLALAGFALQLLAPGEGVWPLALLGVSYATLVAFAVRNLALPGFRLVLLGIVLNLTVIAVNGGMPVSRSALEASGQLETLELLVRHGGVKHHLAGEDDVLAPLGDVIPVPPVGNVVSIGDVLAYAGVAWLVIAGLRPRGRRLRVVPPRIEGVTHAG